MRPSAKPLHNGDPENFYREVLSLDHIDFARAFLKVQDKQKHLVPFVLNPGQQKMAMAIEKRRQSRRPCYIICLKARQFGGSTESEAQVFHRYYTTPGLNAEIVANVSTAAGNMKRMFERFHNNLPAVMQPPIVRRNERVFAYDKWDSQVRFSSAESRDNVGVSDTLAMLHATEVALWPEPKETLDYLFPAVVDNENTLVIIESTARGFNYFHAMWDAATRGDMDYEPVFVSWLDVPEYSHPTSEVTGPLANITEDERLLMKQGATDGQLRWRRWYIKNKCYGSIDTFNQDFPTSPSDAFVASGSCFFEAPALKAALTVPEQKPVAVGVCESSGFRGTDRGPLTVWEMPKPGVEYIIGADVAGSNVVDEKTNDRDMSVAVVFSVKPFRQVATLCYHAYEKIYADDLIALAKMYNDAFLAVERNGLGRAVVTQLIDRYDNLWSEEARGKWTTKYADYPGWETKVSNRNTMLSDLRTMLREQPGAFTDRRLHKQCLSFVQQKNGRWNAESGCHDDHIFATGIAVQMFITTGSFKSSFVVEGGEQSLNERDYKLGMQRAPSILYGPDGLRIGMPMHNYQRPNGTFFIERGAA